MFLFALALFSCSFGYASPAERVESLSSKAILKNTNGYFVLADGSCWKVVPFAKRWRSIGEWWNGVELVPANYNCVPNDWQLSTSIETYSKYENLAVNEADAGNQEELKQCTHLLVNGRTRQVLFAIELHPADCIVQLANEMHADGYQKGYDEGRLSGYKNSTDIYKEAHAAGYQIGYAEGCKAVAGAM